MNFDIGLTGLRVAQQSIDLIGTNIANVSTPGYHRQEAILAPMPGELLSGVPIGGVEVASYRRVIDSILEDTLVRQRPQLEQLNQELISLKSLEATLGSMESQALSDAMNQFFGALRELSADPQSQALRQQAAWAAEGLAAGFRHVGSAVEDMNGQALVEARLLIDQVNGLAGQIAELNSQIELIVTRGGSANLLIDQRDQLILDLSALVEVTTYHRLDGSEATDVLIGGVPIVVKDNSYELDVDPLSDGRIGLTREGSVSYSTDIRGGKLGGLFALRNEMLSEIGTQLDDLATQFIWNINRTHFQSIGTAGSFTTLDGTARLDPDATLSTWAEPIAAGSFRLRLIDPTGQATIHTVAVDPDTDSLTSLAAALGALDPAHLAASVVSGRLHMETSGGWTFDFLPVSTATTGAPWTGSSTPALSGITTAAANETLTATVTAGGQVGVDPAVTVEVRNASGDLLTSLDLGRGYAAGEPVDLYEGLQVAFGTGTLTAGEQFTVEVVADSDPTGFLAAAGMNTLFEGTGAADLAIRSAVRDDPGLLATARGPEGADNLAVRKMALLAETPLSALGDVTVSDAYGLFVTGIGQRIDVREIRQESLRSVVQQLENQRDIASGVDINEEAAKLMVFEKMFQGMARFLQSQQDSMEALIDLV